MDKLKRAALVGFGLVAGAVGSSIVKAADFDKTIRLAGAAANASTLDLKDMSDTALKMGTATQFGAKGAADAMLELAKGGITLAEMKAGALAGTMTLAAAGGLELGSAATYMTNTLNTFGLKADSAASVAAALAGGANASTASVESLGMALSQVGPGAKNAGLAMEETVAVLAMFDQAGIKGSDAGTSLKTMLARLIPTTDAAKTSMKKLGLEFVKSDGSFQSISNIAEQLKSKLSGLSDSQRVATLQTIFGSDATRAATVLMNNGAKGLETFTKATKDKTAADKMAKEQTSGAAGNMRRFKAAVDSLQIAFGLKLLPAVTAVTGALADIVIKITDKVDPAFDGLKSLADKLAPAFGKVRDKISDAFSGVDFSGLGKKLQEDASGWAGTLMTGLQKGFGEGDWGGLGKTLGTGLGRALLTSGELAVQLYAWVGDQIKKVDWVSLGVKMGKQAPMLLAGLAVGILSFDPSALLSGLARNWSSVLIGVITLAFLPLKAGGLIARLLGKVPFVGPMTLWFLRALQKVTRGIAGATARFAVEVVAGIARGLGRNFPKVGTAIEKGLLAVVHLLTRGAPQIGSAVKKWGTKMLSALAPMPGRLAGKAAEAVSGFLGGLTRAAGGRLNAWLRGWPGRMVAKVGNLSNTLFQAGKDLVAGFTRGVVSAIPNALGAVGGLAKRAGNALKDRLLMRSPSRLTMAYGRFFSSGFAIGIKDGTNDVVEKAKALVDKLKEKLQVVKDFAADIRATFTSLADVTSIDTLLMGPNGDSEGGFAKLLATLQGRAADAAAFERGMKSLRGMGLNETTLSQLREAGPEGGLKSMQQILGAGGSGVSQVNAAVKAILRSGDTLGNREAKNKYGIDPSKSQKVKVTVGGNVKLTVDPGGLLKVLRQEIRAQGGDVQKVLGKQR